MKIHLTLLACLLLCACASEPPPPAPTAVAQSVHTRSCGEAILAWTDCYEKYGAQCDELGRIH